MSKRHKVYTVFEFLGCEVRDVEKMRDACNRALEAVAKGEWFDVHFDYEYNGDGAHEAISIVGHRLETDKEMKQRLEQEKRFRKEDEKFKKQQEDNERKMYEALKKKFEGK
jgi:hypothetical protein